MFILPEEGHSTPEKLRASLELFELPIKMRGCLGSAFYSAAEF